MNVFKDGTVCTITDSHIHSNMFSCPAVAGLLIEGAFAGDPGRLDLLRGIRPKHAVTHSLTHSLTLTGTQHPDALCHTHTVSHGERLNVNTTTQCQVRFYAIRL